MYVYAMLAILELVIKMLVKNVIIRVKRVMDWIKITVKLVKIKGN